MTQALRKLLQPELYPDRRKVGQRGFLPLFGTFGLEVSTGIDLPAEPKKSLFYTAQRMGPVELASCAFGQSSKVSYLEMAAAIAAVANGGRLMRPYVVSDILDPEGRSFPTSNPSVPGR